MADQYNILMSRLLIFSIEGSPCSRAYTEHSKKVRRDMTAGNSFRLIAPRENKIGRIESRDFFKNLRLISPVSQVRKGNQILTHPLRQIAFPNHHEAVRLFERKRADQKRIDNAENRGVGADTQSQSDDDYSSESRPVKKHANAVAQVL